MKSCKRGAGCGDLPDRKVQVYPDTTKQGDIV
jgi:hypothetical protein